jgi:hypothetical protein
MSAAAPRRFQKDGYDIEITGPTNRCRVWINGKPALGEQTFTSLQAARLAAFGPYGWTKRHAPRATHDELVALLREAAPYVCGAPFGSDLYARIVKVTGGAS